jgi:hypothetical protein
MMLARPPASRRVTRPSGRLASTIRHHTAAISAVPPSPAISIQCQVAKGLAAPAQAYRMNRAASAPLMTRMVRTMAGMAHLSAAM